MEYTLSSSHLISCFSTIEIQVRFDSIIVMSAICNIGRDSPLSSNRLDHVLTSLLPRFLPAVRKKKSFFCDGLLFS